MSKLCAVSVPDRGGIGGEYTAINSTIQELCRRASWLDRPHINGSFWIGGRSADSAIVLLDPALIGPDYGWRLAYLTGALSVLWCRGCECGSGKPAAG